MTSRPAIGTAVVVVAAFLGLFHFVGVDTWGHGKETFPRMLGLIALFAATPMLVRLEARFGTSNVLGAAALGATALLVRSLVLELREVLAQPDLANNAVDIARNVQRAGTELLRGRNPYSEPCQLGHTVSLGPHVTRVDGELRMYGLRYPYGFPYFPAMIVAYLPFRPLAEASHAIRIGNAFYLGLGSLSAAWIAVRGVPRSERWLAAGLALLAYLGISVIGPEHFRLAVTDVCIAAVAGLGYVALSYRRPLLVGALLGLAQGAKLLPGPLLLLPALAHLETRRERVVAASAYVVVSLACILPGLVPDPEAFVSSTVAFYLTHHGAGDDTSLYFYLPAAAKTPFLVCGALAAAGFSLMGFRWRPATAAAAAGYAWLAYAAFTLFNRMTHLNYLWGVHTLGAAAIAAAALGTRTAPSR